MYVVYNVCMRVNISINDVLLKEVDSYCADMGYMRSALISELLRNKVKGTVQEIKEVENIERVPMIKGVVKGANQCKHGALIGLCKYGC